MKAKFEGYTLNASRGEIFHSALHNKDLPNTGIRITKFGKSEVLAIYHPNKGEVIESERDLLMGFYYLLNLCVIGGLDKETIFKTYGWEPYDIVDLGRMNYILDIHGKMCSIIDAKMGDMKIKQEVVYLIKKLEGAGIKP